ncbi:MAG: VanW family protein [bacterium]|nr:VanW family protein [bacterium]
MSHFFIAEEKLPAKKRSWLASGLVIFFIFLILITAAVGYYENAYAQKFFLGTVIANTNISGLTASQAKFLLAAKSEKLMNNGLPIIYNEKIINITAVPLTTSPDVAFDLFSIQTDKAVENAFAIGRSGNWLKKIQDQFTLFIFSPKQYASYQINEDKITQILKETFGEFENEAKNAVIVYKNGKLDIDHEEHGRIFDYQLINEEIVKRLQNLDSRPITISLKTHYPTILQDQLKLIINDAQKTLALAPISLSVAEGVNAKKSEWIITQDDLIPLITSKFDKEKKQAVIGLNIEATAQFLDENISPDVNIAPIDAKFTIAGDKVSEFKSSIPGQAVDSIISAQKIENAIISKLKSSDAAETKIELIVATVESAIKNNNVNDLGITELLGTGHSSFAGSPRNRRHNIAVGADSVNGALIAPGEEFSLLKTLGKIDAATGYLPELVIKGNETVPEYGGGLCQIGTTVFRGTLATGLPVTARRNHSYRVSYYEPAGTDATIYDPAPDYKFLNDTPSYILIQSRIEGDDLYFDFWGTYDGRIAEQTKPVIFNITYPPATKLIETDTLPPGEKKCTERAHNGADASFDYKVTYSDGALKEENFFSRYRPWQEVCLIGAEKTASSTPASE